MNKCFFSNVENKRSTIRAQATMNNGDGVIATKPIQGCTELNRAKDVYHVIRHTQNDAMRE